MRQENPQSVKTLGVTVLPEYVQSEGIDAVLHNLVEVVGATAVVTSPYVMARAGAQSGFREPPDDAGAGTARLLDRPLFGKREVWVRTAPSFSPNLPHYERLRYQPPPPDDLTRAHGETVARFIEQAQAAGLQVFFQVQAAIPPCYRVQFGGPVDDDVPRLPDGSPPRRRVAKNGSLASPHILAYEHALIRDLCEHYPSIDGLRFDWPEYPPYLLDSAFLDFGPHAEQAAARLGYDFDQLRSDAAALYQKLHGGLTDRDLQTWLEPDGGRHTLLRTLADHPGLADWLRFKAQLVEETLSGFRRVLTEAGGEDKRMTPTAFPPPWSIASGMDFGRVGPLSSAVCCKLYTMHWLMMLRLYGDQILTANPGLSNRLLTKVLLAWLDIADDEGFDSLEQYEYPDPDTPHAVGLRAMARKIACAQAEAGDSPIHVLAHGYGPLDDYRRRLEAAWAASKHGLWMNRYAYLSDEKLRVLGQVARGDT